MSKTTLHPLANIGIEIKSVIFQQIHPREHVAVPAADVYEFWLSTRGSHRVVAVKWDSLDARWIDVESFAQARYRADGTELWIYVGGGDTVLHAKAE